MMKLGSLLKRLSEMLGTPFMELIPYSRYELIEDKRRKIPILKGTLCKLFEVSSLDIYTVVPAYACSTR